MRAGLFPCHHQEEPTRLWVDWQMQEPGGADTGRRGSHWELRNIGTRTYQLYRSDGRSFAVGVWCGDGNFKEEWNDVSAVAA